MRRLTTLCCSESLNSSFLRVAVLCSGAPSPHASSAVSHPMHMALLRRHSAGAMLPQSCSSRALPSIVRGLSSKLKSRRIVSLPRLRAVPAAASSAAPTPSLDFFSAPGETAGDGEGEGLMADFASLGVSEEVQKALAAAHFARPSRVQVHTCAACIWPNY